ncbi:MAG TPA: hypothetical protein PKK69_11585 [Ferruginibacter sp.]|nr:hypothetical protein [Ferruginibacter sp.]
MNSRLMLIAAGVLSIVSAWLPWVTVLGQSTNGFMGEMRGNPGLFFIILGAIIAVMGLINKKWSAVVAILFALMVAGLGFKYYGDATSGDAALVGAKAGYGVYVMMLAGVLGVVGGICAFWLRSLLKFFILLYKSLRFTRGLFLATR